MSDLLVVDEWLWADLSGENEERLPGSQGQAAEFLQKVFTKCDRFVVVEGSPFARKAFAFFRNSTDRRRREIAKFYSAKFIYNSDKSLRLDPAGLPTVPPEVAQQAKEEDHYLVQAFLAAQAKTIITSDGPLAEVLRRNAIPCDNSTDFLRKY